MCALWLMWAVVAALVCVTYARLPASDFYNVTGTGFTGGAARVLVLLGWPISLAAVALMAVALDRLLGRRSRAAAAGRDVAAVASLVLCATIAWPGVITQSNLDAKSSNALAAVGVGIAAAITVAALRPLRARAAAAAQRRRPCGDRAAGADGPGALPWIFANLGFYVGDVPGLAGLHVQEDPARARAPAPARRAPGQPRGPGRLAAGGHGAGRCGGRCRMRPTRLRPVLGGYLALLLGYGVMVAANDGWNEQLVKRGTTSYMLPDVITPAASWGWVFLLAAAAVLYVAMFRVEPRLRPL